jgi:hypothetical protein
LRNANFIPEKDFFIQQQPVPILKGLIDQIEEPDKLPNTTTHGSIYMISVNNNEFIDIRSRSWIFRQFTEKPLNIYRIFVPMEKKKVALKALLGE